MAQQIADRIQIIDCDTHVSEPYDLWTSRVSQKWGDLVPHVVHSEESGRDVWALGGEYNPYGGVGGSAMAGWKEFPPNGPPTLAEADPACYDASARLQRMDDYGIHAAVVYPNVGGFGSGAFLRMKEPALMLECVRAYNDFLADWISPAPERFIPIPAMPFWDVDACVAEMHRVAKRGFKGIMWGSEPQVFDQPLLSDHHWEPIWATAQDLQLTVNFHTASGDLHEMREGSYEGNGRQANFARTSVLYFMGNARAVSELIVSGICHRYPALNFVSVESGVGWIPFLLEGLDWQWVGSGVRQEHPEYDLLPSEYFHRQIYGCFWFERASVHSALRDLGPDNILYETDFPHPTSMSPGPVSPALKPRDFVEDNLLGDLPEEVLRKVLRENAARIYRLD